MSYLIDEIMANRLLERRVNFSSSQWEGRYNHLYNVIRCYDDVKGFIKCSDINTRIFTLVYIVPEIADLINIDERRELYDLIYGQFSDNRQVEIGSTMQCEDEETITVSSAARYALKKTEEHFRFYNDKRKTIKN
ncbi:MAG: hypothetical protein Q7S74_02065 [Nanoarchaeota archaeon]|nr:hypothetical protein [Nanoarchaeota archaeon]